MQAPQGLLFRRWVQWPLQCRCNEGSVLLAPGRSYLRQLKA